MKRFGKIAVCLAGVLALNAGLRAAETASANNPVSANPYAAIAVRNIFGLNPPPPPDDPAKDAEKSLPKITPTGIQNYFGQLQVLFKVAPTAKPGPSAKEQYYTLSQGERQDEIEVMTIDETNSIVTFDNHGFTQELPLAVAPNSGGGAPPASSSPGGMNPAMARGAPGGGGNSGPGGFTPFGARPGANNGGTPNSNPGFNGGSPNSANSGMSFDGSTQGHIYQPEASTMTPEQSTILIEAQRAALMNNPNPPYSPNLLPPTELTKFNTPGGN